MILHTGTKDEKSLACAHLDPPAVPCMAARAGRLRRPRARMHDRPGTTVHRLRFTKMERGRPKESARQQPRKLCPCACNLEKVRSTEKVAPCLMHHATFV